MTINCAGTLQHNSGYGSVATAYGCRGWVNFNGTGTVGIRSNGNISSITDNGVGYYTCNFANAMPDANYAAVVSAGHTSYVDVRVAYLDANYTTSSFRFSTTNNSNKVDTNLCNVAIFR